MKNLALLMGLMLFPTFAYSQWGVKGGINSSNIIDAHYAPMLSAHIGGTYDIRLSRKWFFTPELQAVYIGANINDDGLIMKGGHMRFFSLELPVNISFRPPVSRTTSILVEGGLYGRFGLFGNTEYRFYDSSIDVNESTFSGYNRFDMGIQLGLGLQVKKYYGVLTLQQGLTSAQKGGGYYHHQVLKLSLGHKF
jgi:hypothetical protein